MSLGSTLLRVGDHAGASSERATLKAVLDTASLVRAKAVGGAIRSSIEELAGWAQVSVSDTVELKGLTGDHRIHTLHWQA